MGKPAAFNKLIAYLWWLSREVDEAIRLGLTSTAAIAITLDNVFWCHGSVRPRESIRQARTFIA